MQFENKKTIFMLTVFIVLGSITMSHAAAAVEWDVERTLQLKSEPIDVTVESSSELWLRGLRRLAVNSGTESVSES